MTGQVNDTFNYKKVNYSISGIEYPDKFFNIGDYGLSPGSYCTACWRGFVAFFAINRNKQLILQHLHTNAGSLEEDDMPRINGEKPIVNNKNQFFGPLEYRNIGLPLTYSGGVLITDGFISERYIHMGFQSPLIYELVLELKFENGLFVSETDLSDMIKSQRAITSELTDEEKWENLPKWIDEQFDLSYIKLYKSTMEEN